MDSRFLQQTKLLDFSDITIRRLVETRGWRRMPFTEKVKAIHAFVKDEILFGYNTDDNLPASQVLAQGYGQCNTKATLFMALLRSCNVPCQIHGFAIDKSVQRGVMTPFVYKQAPAEILHSWVEIFAEDETTVYCLEGYILDRQYFSALRQKFQPDPDGSFVGYGVATDNFRNPPVVFDNCNTFIQSKAIVKDFGVYLSPDALFAAHKQKVGAIKRMAFRKIGRPSMNNAVSRIRSYR